MSPLNKIKIQDIFIFLLIEANINIDTIKGNSLTDNKV